MAIDESVHQHKYPAGRERDADHLVQHRARPAVARPRRRSTPARSEPAGPDDFAPLFPMDLILQEVSQDRYVDIPGAVLDVYRQWRPTPALPGPPPRAGPRHAGPDLLQVRGRLARPARHKPNTAVPQAYYNAKAGIRRLTTETGAGQWGTALAFACALFGLECEIWQVGASYDQKPYRRLMMEAFGGQVHRSPSDADGGRPRRPGQADPDSPGSLGIAISEAVEVAAPDPETRYALGSVLNHVLMHQTIIGEEALLQLAKAGERAPDLLVGCTGGGSNFGGLAFPFLREKLAGRMNPTIRAVEPASCPSLTRGVYAYDFGDTAGHDPADEDAHAGPRLHPRPDPRRRPALPRHGPPASPTSTSSA